MKIPLGFLFRDLLELVKKGGNFFVPFIYMFDIKTYLLGSSILVFSTNHSGDYLLMNQVYWSTLSLGKLLLKRKRDFSFKRFYVSLIGLFPSEEHIAVIVLVIFLEYRGST